MSDDDSECCGPDGKPFSAHKNSVDRAWAMREIGRLRAERDARVTELLESNNALLERARKAEEERDQARADADWFRGRCQMRVEERDAAREALRSYTCDCAETLPEGVTACNGDVAEIWCGNRARAALARLEKETP